MEFRQTWWNNNVEKMLDTFNIWIGDSNAYTKIYSRNYIYHKQFKSIVDLGCANASMYDGFQKEMYKIDYTGVDSCIYLVDKNKEKGINCVLSDVVKTPFKDSSFEIVFSRHIIEHQPEFKTYLQETIRIAEKEVLHIFFKVPSDKEHIFYTEHDNLYHNTYNKNDIETYLKNDLKVKEFSWSLLNNNDECALHIILN